MKSLAAFALFAALQLASLPNAIRGIVIKSGTAFEQPLQDARLELTGPNGTLVIRSDSNGRFVFSNLRPGGYRLAVACDGFIRQSVPKTIMVGRDQAVADVRLEMEPAPTAAGRILDVFAEPIANIMIEALRRSYDVRGNPRFSRAATALTDDRGEYRIFWLDPGDYFFYAASPPPNPSDPEPPPAVAPTYYPGVSTPEDAKSLRLGIGREMRVDFRLQAAAFWNVGGQTMSALTSRSIAAGISLTPPMADPSFSRYNAQSSAAGSDPGGFGIDKVPPGTYIVRTKSLSGDPELTAFRRIVLRPLPPSPVIPRYSVTATLSPALSINGRLFVESNQTIDLRTARINLLSVDPDLPSPRSVLAQQDGQFVLKDTLPGTYVLDVPNLSQDHYLKAARFAGKDILENPLALEARDAANSLQILLGTDGGHIQVAAYDGSGTLHAGAQFVLVPDLGRRNRRDQYRIALAGDDGQAMLRGIPPGTYKLFAWEELEPNAYLNADFIQSYESLGTPVNIASGDNPSISARLIPKD